MTRKYKDKLLEILELAKFARSKGRLSTVYMTACTYKTDLFDTGKYTHYNTIEEIEKALLDYKHIRYVSQLYFKIKLKVGEMIWSSTQRVYLTSYWNRLKHNI